MQKLDSWLRVGFPGARHPQAPKAMENPPEALDLNFIGHQKQLQAWHFHVIPKVFEVNEPTVFFHIFPLDVQHQLAQHPTGMVPMVRGCLASVVHLIAVPNQVKDSVRL